MEYIEALNQSWRALEGKELRERYAVRLLNDEYEIDLEKRSVISKSSSVEAKPYYSVILLHYLKAKLSSLPETKGEWISFRELPGGQAYYSNFKKRVIGTILRKFKDSPDGLLNLEGRFPARKENLADISIVLDVFDGVPLLINFWRGDEEFGPDVNMLFDKNIGLIFCTEDIVVLSELVAHNL